MRRTEGNMNAETKVVNNDQAAVARTHNQHVALAIDT